MSFVLPVHKSRVFILDYPEILLVAVTTVAAKLCFPLNRYQSLLQDTSIGLHSGFGWNKWCQGMDELHEEPPSAANELDLDKVTADQVARMTSKELDAYFSHVASSIDKRSKYFLLRPTTLVADTRLDENPVVGFFPSENAPDLEPPPPQITEDQIDERLSRILISATKDGEKDDSGSDEKVDLNHGSSTYEAFRSVEDMPEIAQRLYSAAGKLSGMKFRKLSETDQDSRIFNRPLVTRDLSCCVHVGTENTGVAAGQGLKWRRRGRWSHRSRR